MRTSLLRYIRDELCPTQHWITTAVPRKHGVLAVWLCQMEPSSFIHLSSSLSCRHAACAKERVLQELKNLCSISSRALRKSFAVFRCLSRTVVRPSYSHQVAGCRTLLLHSILAAGGAPEIPDNFPSVLRAHHCAACGLQLL